MNGILKRIETVLGDTEKLPATHFHMCHPRGVGLPVQPDQAAGTTSLLEQMCYNQHRSLFGFVLFFLSITLVVTFIRTKTGESDSLIKGSVHFSQQYLLQLTLQGT